VVYFIVMTETIRGDYGKHPRRPFRAPLQLLQGEVTAERFNKCDSYLKEEGAHMFFRTGRRSVEGKIHIGVFRRAVGQVTLSKAELLVYQLGSTPGATK